MKYLLIITITLFANSVLASEKFTVDGDILHYNSEAARHEDDQWITNDDLTAFKELLSKNPNITTVYLTSWGGDIETSYEIADLIIDYDLNTHVVEICYSACPTLLLAGKKRTLARGAKIGFHRGWWDPVVMKDYYESEKKNSGWKNPFDFASWVYEDAQEEIHKDFQYLLERGVDPFFAIETIKAKPDENDGWYPRRKELLKSNFLTK